MKRLTFYPCSVQEVFGSRSPTTAHRYLPFDEQTYTNLTNNHNFAAAAIVPKKNHKTTEQQDFQQRRGRAQEITKNEQK